MSTVTLAHALSVNNNNYAHPAQIVHNWDLRWPCINVHSLNYTNYICRDASRTKNLTLLMKEGHCMHGPADL